MTDNYVNAEMKLLALKKREIVNLEKVEEGERERDYALERLKQVGNMSLHTIRHLHLKVKGGGEEKGGGKIKICLFFSHIATTTTQ